MARSISRSPLFHKGLTAATSNGTTLPMEASAPPAAQPDETESSGNKVLRAHHIRWFRETGRDDVAEVGGKSVSPAVAPE